MKKLCLVLVFNFTLGICFAQHFDKLVISSFEFHPNYSLRSKNMFDTYDVKICIENVSNSPVFFWSWHKRRFTDFRFTNNNIYFIYRPGSDAPVCCLVMPRLTVSYKGQIYFRNNDFKYLLKSQDISFLFYDALKYSKEDYLSKDKDYILTNTMKRKSNEFAIIADTIKYKKTSMFQLWK